MGYYDRTYHKVVGITGGMGFSGGGPLPRAIMGSNTSVKITVKDIHGNEVVLGDGGNSNFARLYEGIEVSDIVSVVQGAGGVPAGPRAFVLW